jgi:hypothetical protein
VYGNARVTGDAWVTGDARVYGNAQVYGDARVYGNAQVYGNARVTGDARVYGNARVTSQVDMITVLDIGSERGCLTIYRDSEIGVRVTRGCFTGSIEEFLEAVESTHGDNMHGKVYKSLIETAKIQFGLD